jgi:XFP-like protein/acetokinase family protein
MAISEPGDPPAATRGEPGSASGKVESIVDARRLLTINTGSSSLKAALYRLREDTTETPELRAEASRIGGQGGGPRLANDRGETLDERRGDLPDHAAALEAPMSQLRDRGLDRDDLLAAVGHRIVHGGDRHREPQRVAPEVVADLFTGDKPVVFAFHGYQRAIHEIVHGHVDVDRFHVRGFSEQGTTTTSFDMVVLNGMSRYHLAAEALRRAGKTSGSRPGDRAPPPDLRVRGGDRKSHRLLEGALRGPARDKQLVLNTMNPPTETLVMGLLKDQDRGG